MKISRDFNLQKIHIISYIIIQKKTHILKFLVFVKQ